MSSNIQRVEESNYGLYAWQNPNGSLVANTDGDLLNIPSERGDLRKISKLVEAARYYGITEGEPVFLPGQRRVSDSELDHQKERLDAGLTPDIYDAGALMDELRAAKANRNG